MTKQIPYRLLPVADVLIAKQARHDAALVAFASLSSRERSQGQHEAALDSDQLVKLIQTNLLIIPSYSTGMRRRGLLPGLIHMLI